MTTNDNKAIEAHLIAMLHFSQKGYRCYVDIAGNGGPIDFIAVNEKTRDTLYIDVKTRRQSKTGGGRTLTATQKKLKVKLVYVDLKNKKVNDHK